MIRIQQADSQAALASAAALADTIWHEYFPCILSMEQIDYMVEKFQSLRAMQEQMAHQGYTYYIVYAEQEPVGYFAVCAQQDNTLLLSKLYLLKAYRGRGIAREMFRAACAEGKRRGAQCIWLTVNKRNAQAIAVYQHLGMKKIRQQTVDIGGGFVMDDDVYALEL